MNRTIIKNLHISAATLAMLCIASFWISSVIAELFFSHSGITLVKQIIVYALLLFIPSMMITGITGNKLGGRSKNVYIVRKRKRMIFIALNGVLVLLPCAFLLYFRANSGQFDTTFYLIQIVELIAGAVNFTLMVKSMLDAKSLIASYKKR